MPGIVLVFDLSFIYTASYLIFVSIFTQCFHPGWKSLLLVLFMVTKFNILYEHTCNILNGTQYFWKMTYIQNIIIFIDIIVMSTEIWDVKSINVTLSFVAFKYSISVKKWKERSYEIHTKQVYAVLWNRFVPLLFISLFL